MDIKILSEGYIIYKKNTNLLDYYYKPLNQAIILPPYDKLIEDKIVIMSYGKYEKYEKEHKALLDMKKYVEKTSSIMKYNDKPLNMCNSNGILDFINEAIGDDDK